MSLARNQYAVLPKEYGEFLMPKIEPSILPKSFDAFKKFCDHLLTSNVKFALGGSALLAHYGLADSVADWDITTDEPESVLRQVLKPYNYSLGSKKMEYATKFNYKIQLESDTVDLMGSFAFRTELGICHIPTVVCGNWNNIPLGSLEAWAVAYRLLGRDKRADDIFSYFQKSGSKRDIILKLLEQPLPHVLRQELIILKNL